MDECLHVQEPLECRQEPPGAGNMRTEMANTPTSRGNDHLHARNAVQRAATTNKTPRITNLTPARWLKINLKIGLIHRGIHFVLKEKKLSNFDQGAMR